jgi:hypothetical protein
LQKHQDNAVGMSYKVMKGMDLSKISMYLEGHDEQSSAEILDKNLKYYSASVDKSVSRLELSFTRLKNVNLSEEDNEMLEKKIQLALKWLKDLKDNIKQSQDKSEFISATSYKKWHVFNLLPSVIEGYFITTLIQTKINRIVTNLSESSHKMHLRNAQKQIKKSRELFSELLDLSEASDLNNAEELRIKAYNELIIAQSILKSKFSQFSC